MILDITIILLCTCTGIAKHRLMRRKQSPKIQKNYHDYISRYMSWRKYHLFNFRIKFLYIKPIALSEWKWEYQHNKSIDMQASRPSSMSETFTSNKFFFFIILADGDDNIDNNNNNAGKEESESRSTMTTTTTIDRTLMQWIKHLWHYLVSVYTCVLQMKLLITWFTIFF